MNKMKYASTNSISVNRLNNLKHIFEDNGWPIISNLGDNLFDNFCSMLSHLDKHEQDLVIELSHSFLWVNVESYLPYFDTIFSILIDHYYKTSVKEIIFIPLVSEEDYNNHVHGKSSHFLYYLIKSEIIHFKSSSNKIKISLKDSYNSISISEMTDDVMVCLLDDFIGTGETAISAIECLIKHGLSKSSLCVLTLVGQKMGIEKIEGSDMCDNVFCSVYRDRALSDHLDIYGEKISVMQSIENKITVKKKFKFGYMQSEALVRMQRTPNNTFPIYWLSSKKIPNVPFPR